MKTVYGNDISYADSKFVNSLVNLKILILGANRHFPYLPISHGLAGLEALDIQNSAMKVMPDIHLLKNLTFLGISNNRIPKLPNDPFKNQKFLYKVRIDRHDTTFVPNIVNCQDSLLICQVGANRYLYNNNGL